MKNEASKRLDEQKHKIIQAWEVRANKEIFAANKQESLALRDSLPEFIEQVVKGLSTTRDRSQLRQKKDGDENARLGRQHGSDRAGALRYTIDQLISEYHILRQVICDHLEDEAPLSAIEREVIVCAIEQAVNDAATEFSDSLRNIQERFTHTLAHDLRGPITTSKLNAQLMFKRNGDIAAKRIAASMDHLDLMINDLLDAGKLRAGEKLQFTLADFDLDKTLKEVVEEINVVHENRLVYHSSGALIGHWNENGVLRVIENLISNALKFSAKGTPITVELVRSESHAEVSVHNTGKPIPKESLDILFEQYRRAENAEGKKGWGLGLTVVKGITEALGGSVKVGSSEAKGTFFKVFLPLAK